MSTTSTVDTIIVRIPTQPYALNNCGLAYTLEQYSTINWRKICKGFYYQDGTVRMNDRMIHTRQLMEYGSYYMQTSERRQYIAKLYIL